MHSHHSHSGQYVSHAVDTLDQTVQKAEQMGFQQFCLTEHMPRLSAQLLYPEEEDKNYTPEKLQEVFNEYHLHARRLQKESKHMEILVGYESECVDEEHIQYAMTFKDQFDMVIGSVHHVFGIPIDFSGDLWKTAQEKASEGTIRSFYRHYFELQHKMIQFLQPHVIGHFDLIRLYAPLQELDSTTGKVLKDINIEKDWPEVWNQIIENITLAISYGALFELNSAAIRKGWDTPYPKLDIAKAIIAHGDSRFCLSDDSHGTAQVGLNYHKMWTYVKDVLKLQHIYYLSREDNKTVVKQKLVQEMDQDKFWDQYKY